MGMTKHSHLTAKLSPINTRLRKRKMRLPTLPLESAWLRYKI